MSSDDESRLVESLQEQRSKVENYLIHVAKDRPFMLAPRFLLAMMDDDYVRHHDETLKTHGYNYTVSNVPDDNIRLARATNILATGEMPAIELRVREALLRVDEQSGDAWHANNHIRNKAFDIRRRRGSEEMGKTAKWAGIAVLSMALGMGGLAIHQAFSRPPSHPSMVDGAVAKTNADSGQQGPSPLKIAIWATLIASGVSILRLLQIAHDTMNSESPDIVRHIKTSMPDGDVRKFVDQQLETMEAELQTKLREIKSSPDYKESKLR